MQLHNAVAPTIIVEATAHFDVDGFPHAARKGVDP